MHTILRAWPSAALATLACAAPAVAAEPGHSGGLPQLNVATYSSQLFWAAVLFLALYLLMSRVALPRVGAVVEGRNRRIGEDLDRATAMQQEADAALVEYERALTSARTDAQAIVRSVGEELARSAAESQQAVAAELDAQTQAAEARIEAAQRNALEQVRTIAAETARAAASRIAGCDIDPGRVDAAVQAAAQERR